MRIPEFIIFTKKERLIILGLSCLLVIVYVGNILIKPKFSEPEKTVSLSDILSHHEESEREKSIRDAQSVLDSVASKKAINQERYRKKKWKKVVVKVTEFDPNSIDSIKWISLGVHRYSVSKILNYRSKGGRFRHCEDLYKIYGIDSNYISRLLPYCKIVDDKKSNRKVYNKKNKWKKPVIKLSDFDPNIIDSLRWISLGVHRYSVSKILNYRSKGGEFRQCEDLYKIYGIDSSHIATILPFCQIDETNLTAKKSYTNDYKKQKRQVVDINTADSTQLRSLYGVGEYTSRAIIDYRNSLGGFHSVSQLTEIFAFKPEIIEDNKDYLVCKGDISKLNINTFDIDKLRSHRYMSYKLAKLIVNYRQQHGDYGDISEIRNIVIVNDSIYQKLKPYLSTK